MFGTWNISTPEAVELGMSLPQPPGHTTGVYIPSEHPRYAAYTVLPMASRIDTLQARLSSAYLQAGHNRAALYTGSSDPVTLATALMETCKHTECFMLVKNIENSGLPKKVLSRLYGIRAEAMSRSGRIQASTYSWVKSLKTNPAQLRALAYLLNNGRVSKKTEKEILDQLQMGPHLHRVLRMRYVPYVPNDSGSPPPRVSSIWVVPDMDIMTDLISKWDTDCDPLPNVASPFLALLMARSLWNSRDTLGAYSIARGYNAWDIPNYPLADLFYSTLLEFPLPEMMLPVNTQIPGKAFNTYKVMMSELKNPVRGPTLNTLASSDVDPASSILLHTAVALKEEGHQSAAIRCCRRCLALYPGDFRGPLELGRVLIHCWQLSDDSRSLAQAEAFLQTAQSLAPEDAFVCNELCVVSMLKNRKKHRTMLLLKKALHMWDAGDVPPAILCNLGLALLRTGKPIDACRAFWESKKMDAFDHVVWAGLGHGMDILKRTEEAVVAYEMALAMNGSQKEVTELLVNARALVHRR